MAKDWKKEVARDCIALGSVPFYLIVVVRTIVGGFKEITSQLVIGILVLVALSFLIKGGDMYAARGFALWMFTSLVYRHNLYTVFAFLLWIFLIYSSYYLKIKKNSIIKGVSLGVVSALMGYYLAPFFY